MIQAKAKGEYFIFDLGFYFYPFSSFMFVDFKNVDDANLALATIHGHPFDARHTFKVNRFSDIEKYAELDESYVEPELEEYTPRVCFGS